MERIVVLGGTGFIGRHLISLLKDRYHVVVLTRDPSRYKQSEHVSYAAWDVNDQHNNPIDGAMAVINLAGENIAGRWTRKRREQIMLSRTSASNYVAAAILRANNKPLVWIQASATGFYGASSGTIDEETLPGSGFLAQVCQAWEAPTKEVHGTGVRVVIVRTGLVLSPDGGLWQQIEKGCKLGLGLVLGSGKQQLPWIDMEDEVGAMRFLLENKLCEGVYNLAAPQSCTMSELIHHISLDHFHLFTLRIHGCLVRLLLGADMANEVMLVDQKVTPKRLLEAGYQFKHEGLKEQGLKD